MTDAYYSVDEPLKTLCSVKEYYTLYDSIHTKSTELGNLKRKKVLSVSLGLGAKMLEARAVLTKGIDFFFFFN